jgi:hypothetical protein
MSTIMASTPVAHPRERPAIMNNKVVAVTGIGLFNGHAVGRWQPDW